jgi:hypothetical protein
MKLPAKTAPTNRANYAQKFVKNLAPTLSSKRARVITKHLAKAADYSFFMVLPNLVAQYVSPQKDTIHVVVDQVVDNELLDHGQWFALIPFILDRRDLNVEVSILKKSGLTSQTTKFRNFIDYLIEEELTGTFTVNVYEGQLSDMAKDTLEAVDVYLTVSPSKQYWSDKANQQTLKQLVAQDKTKVVIADIDRTALLFSLSCFNQFCVGTHQEIKVNPAGLQFKTQLSKQLSHAGLSLELDTLSTDVKLVNDFTITSEELYQASLHFTRLIHFGDSLRQLPDVPFTSPSFFFDSVVADVETGQVQYAFDGNYYRLQMQLPQFTIDNYCASDLNHQAQLCLYALVVNQTVHNEFARVLEQKAS